MHITGKNSDYIRSWLFIIHRSSLEKSTSFDLNFIRWFNMWGSFAYADNFARNTANKIDLKL